MMDGDLSLSQSFGGLRIANPDDTPTSDQNEPLTQTNNAADTSNSNSHDPASPASPEPYSVSPGNNASYPLSSAGTSAAQPQIHPHPSNRLSQSYGHLDLPSSRHAANLSQNLESTSGYRPSSTYFPHEPTSNPATRASSYRARAES